MDLQLTDYGRMILRASAQRAEREGIPMGLALRYTVTEENLKADRVRHELGLPPLTKDTRPVWVQRIRGTS